jgi:tRNA (guanine37-N1)-methyltransferase
MRIDVISAVPEILKSPLEESIVKRAREKKITEIYSHNLRDYSTGKYRQIDDKPFGGGSGMVLKPEPFFRCIRKLLSQRKYDNIIYLSPQGTKLNQRIANKLSLNKNLMLLCGHYKGIDQRIIDRFVTMEISLGNFVLTGGELAAAVLIDSIVRLIPGVLGDSEAALTDSYQVESGFDAPQYTRPAEYEDMKVPDVLLEGDHKKIQEWRLKMGTEKYRRVKRKKKE